MVLRSIERRLERLAADGMGRVFSGAVRPLDIARRVVREMADSRSTGVRGQPVVANEFRIALPPADLGRLSGIGGSLLAELRESARAKAHSEGWTLMGPVRVEMSADPALRDGTFAVTARMREADPRSGALLVGDGRKVVLGSGVTSLGRLADCTVSFDDPDVSRRHAEIRPDSAGFVLVDLDSTNGTAVNGRPVARHRLVDGDRVSLGSSTAFEFRSG